MKNTHVLVIPYPAQGHVIPLIELARCLTSNGVKVTFVNSDLNHKRVMSAWLQEDDDPSDLMEMVSLPDGLEPGDDRNDIGKLTAAIYQVMPSRLEELIKGINEKHENKITYIVADYCMVWVAKIAETMGIRLATFCSGSASCMALIMSIQKLLDDQVIDTHGVPLQDQMIQLSATMPSMGPAHLPWACMGSSTSNKIVFDILKREGKEAAEAADRIICNSAMELEPEAFTLIPKMLPIGPLLATNRSKKQGGQFWNADSFCLTWLDQQEVCSVIYVAFGSITIFDQAQFEELALALELTNKPFLWVVRPGIDGSNDYVYPSGYMERVGTRGKMISWAPQQEVLKHPSVACFMSHCGWNSTMEGVTNGVPFLCWPYFGDQLLNTTYVCDIWKTGMRVNQDDTGIVTQEEIKNKVEQLLSNNIVKKQALKLKEDLMGNVQAPNSSNKNLANFIDRVKEEISNNTPVEDTCK